jgi:transposase
VHKELRKPRVTLQLLWEEYKQAAPGGIGYSWFCEQYKAWKEHVDPVMRIEHKAGDKLFVDWAGDTIDVVDATAGVVRPAQLFVAALGSSSYTYAEATWTQQLADWLGAHIRALRFFGGAPRLIVPDNTKTAIKRVCFFEPGLNRSYADMAAHYGAAILPTRVRKPRDKAVVESAVLHVERRIVARLRNQRFFSLEALNEAIAEELDSFNDEPFQKLEGSRKSRFEAIDRPALGPLPDRDYQIGEWTVCRAGIDYHVEVDRHYYSVPYRLIRRKLDVHFTDHTVEVFYRGERVASHMRSAQPHGHTTVTDHMPSSHRRYAEWTPERMVGWATSIGPETAALCRTILTQYQHPEHGFRACLGIMRLAKRYGNERCEAACRRAVAAGAFRYRSVESILSRGLDAAPLFEPGHDVALPDHEHIRGSGYYN